MICAIYIRETSGQYQLALEQAELVAGSGIVGDRFFGKKKWPGQNLTLIEAESIAQFNHHYGRHIPEYATHRNIITKGVSLNDLVGCEFNIGGVKLRGVQLCDPCILLGERLANDLLSPMEAEAAFVQKGGLRCDVIHGGIIAVGMVFTS